MTLEAIRARRWLTMAHRQIRPTSHSCLAAMAATGLHLKAMSTSRLPHSNHMSRLQQNEFHIVKNSGISCVYSGGNQSGMEKDLDNQSYFVQKASAACPTDQTIVLYKTGYGGVSFLGNKFSVAAAPTSAYVVIT